MKRSPAKVEGLASDLIELAPTKEVAQAIVRRLNRIGF
jgi:hypothetical protein